MPALVVEEPEISSGTDELRVLVDGNVTIVTPMLAGERGAHGFSVSANASIGRLVAPLVGSETDLIYWYYTPMALGAEPPGVHSRLTVFDAMDDLASFRGAPAAMRIQEARLLQRADLVFTGGPTLYRQRRDQHPAVYCFPSGVDRDHFAAAMNGIPRPAELNQLPRPILGYYGVLDERLDLKLLTDVADLRPEWTIALVGPAAKIDRASIPTRHNIVRFGQQPYSDLPGFLACFDVALMPFALNDATRAISPTKTLEYLAGGKPVISTPVADVVELYGDVVRIVSAADELVSVVESLWRQPAGDRRAWHARAQRLVSERGWDATAGKMLELMSRAMRARPELPLAEPAVALTA